MGVGLAQLLSQALCQGRHCVLGGAVEMHISAVRDTMSAHAATGEGDIEHVGVKTGTLLDHQEQVYILLRLNTVNTMLH